MSFGVVLNGFLLAPSFSMGGYEIRIPDKYITEKRCEESTECSSKTTADCVMGEVV